MSRLKMRNAFLVFVAMPILLVAFQNCAPYDESYMKFSQAKDLTSEAELLEEAAHAILKENLCNDCHGNRNSMLGGVYLYDREELVQNGYIIPGDPDGSEVYINTGGGHNGVSAFADEDREAIAAWIDALAD